MLATAVMVKLLFRTNLRHVITIIIGINEDKRICTSGGNSIDAMGGLDIEGAYVICSEGCPPRLPIRTTKADKYNSEYAVNSTANRHQINMAANPPIIINIFPRTSKYVST